MAHPNAVHLSVLHPLVRQAARSQELSEVAHVKLFASSESPPAGEYPFALYHWRKVGVQADDRLVAVAAEPELDGAIMLLLAEASDVFSETQADDRALDALDRRHHDEWSTARANHVAENRELVQHRLQSLNVSHQARCKLLKDQLERATDERIHRMKEAELARANYDYERRVAELESAAKRADIHAILVRSRNAQGNRRWPPQARRRHVTNDLRLQNDPA